MSKSPPGVNLKQPNNKYTAEYRNNFIWDDDSLKFQNLDHSGSKTKNKNSIPELNSGRKLLFNEFKSSLIQIPFTNHLQLDRNHLQPRNRIIDSLVGRERATAVSLPIKPLRKRENHVKIFKPDRVPKGALPMIESGLISAYQDLRFLSKDAIQPLIYHQHQEKMVENITPMPPIAQSSSLATDKVTTRIQEFKHIEKEELFPRQTTPVDALKPLLMNEATEFYYQLLSFTGYNFAPTHTYFEFIAMNIENETFIILILQKFAEYLKNYNVDYAEIRCDIIKIWISNPAFFINMDSIDFNCAIFNESAINLVSSKSQRLKSSSKYDFSATIIQKNWRMYRQIEKYKIDTIVLRTTRRIQKIARANASKRRMKIEARERYENVYLPKYLKLNSDLKNEYAKYFKGKRTIIHFAFSPIIKKTVTCNINVGRFILCLQDPNVTLCIIVPQMNDEIYSYYYTAFGIYI